VCVVSVVVAAWVIAGKRANEGGEDRVAAERRDDPGEDRRYDKDPQLLALWLVIKINCGVVSIWLLGRRRLEPSR
jgi:hypothetical protein